MASITIKNTKEIPVDSIIAVFKSSGIHRPTDDRSRIEKMFKAAYLVLSAWEGDQLVGIARSLTDFCYCCYLSDLAVHKDYQNKGIGKALLEATRVAIGPQSMLLLVAAKQAKGYYQKIGMQLLDRAFIYNREN